MKAKRFLGLEKPRSYNESLAFAGKAVNLMSGYYSYKKLLGFDVYQNIPYWENMYYENDEYATACNIIATMIGGSGWQYEAENDILQKRWNEWKIQIDLDTQMLKLLTTKMALGNSLAIIAKGDPALGLPHVFLQHIHPYQSYPVYDSIGVVKAWNIYADTYGVGTPKGVIHTMDMLHFTNSLYGKNTMGLALGQQVYIRLARKRKVELICSLISQNMAAPLKHVKVNLETYERKKPDADTPSPAKKRIDDTTEYVTRRVNAEEEFVFDVLVTEDDIEIITIEAGVDLSSVISFLKHDQNLVNSALSVPPVFKAMPDDSNRATSWNELLAFALWLKQHWMRDTLQMQKKLVPQVLGVPNPGGKFIYQPIITKDRADELRAYGAILIAGGFETAEHFRSVAGIAEESASDQQG